MVLHRPRTFFWVVARDYNYLRNYSSETNASMKGLVYKPTPSAWSIMRITSQMQQGTTFKTIKLTSDAQIWLVCMDKTLTESFCQRCTGFYDIICMYLEKTNKQNNNNNNNNNNNSVTAWLRSRAWNQESTFQIILKNTDRVLCRYICARNAVSCTSCIHHDTGWCFVVM